MRLFLLPQDYFRCPHLITTTGVLWLLLSVQAVLAQERIVDDAAITNYRSFQIETWYGEQESVFMPAFGVTSWLEIGTGLQFDSRNDLSFEGWLLEAKVINADYETAGQSWGLVLGTDLDTMGHLNEFYAYLPYSRLLPDGESVLHLNAGLSAIDVAGTTRVNVIYGVRGDFNVLSAFDLLAGIYGEQENLGYYTGIRADLVPDLLQLIVTYGRGFESGHRFPGPAIQLSFTPPPRLW